MTDKNRIIYINEKLKQLIEDSKLASETKKKFLRIGYRLFVEEKRRLEKKEVKTDLITLELTSSVK
jgi:hypothetical protein